MLSTVFAFLACATFPVSDPLQAPARMGLNQPAIEVGAYMTSTTLLCRNFSTFDHLLVFGRTGLSSTVTVVLHSGDYVRYDYTPESLQGMMIEIVGARSTTSFVTSGSLALSLPSGSSDESLWFVPGVSGLVTWQQVGCDVEEFQPSPSMLPSYLGAAGPGDGRANAAAQAPIAVPIGGVISGGIPRAPAPM
jgi:hypothetical protein